LGTDSRIYKIDRTRIGRIEQIDADFRRFRTQISQIFTEFKELGHRPTQS
jgi:hypothetical protein